MRLYQTCCFWFAVYDTLWIRFWRIRNVKQPMQICMCFRNICFRNFRVLYTMMESNTWLRNCVWPLTNHEYMCFACKSNKNATYDSSGVVVAAYSVYETCPVLSNDEHLRLLILYRYRVSLWAITIFFCLKLLLIVSVCDVHGTFYHFPNWTKKNTYATFNVWNAMQVQWEIDFILHHCGIQMSHHIDDLWSQTVGKSYFSFFLLILLDYMHTVLCIIDYDDS